MIMFWQLLSHYTPIMITVNVHRLHTVLFTITLPSIHTLLFTCAFIFTMWIFIPTLLYNCLYTMFALNIYCYIRYCLQLLSQVYLLCCLHMLSFSQCDYFSIITVQLCIWLCLHWIFTITCSTVYNYSPQFSVFAVYICIPFHNVIFFHNYCPIDSITMSIAHPQHILAVLLQLVSPINLLRCLHMHSFSQSDIFSQLLPNWLYNNVYSISLTYTYSTVYNTLLSILTLLYTYAFLFTMWIFFHSYCIIF